MSAARLATGLAGIGLVVLVVTGAVASSGTDPQAPDASNSQMAEVIRTGPGQLLMRNLTGSPEEPMPAGTLSTGLTRLHIGG